MKLPPRIVPILLAAAAVAHSQDGGSSVFLDSEKNQGAFTTASILGEIPDGTPPAPEPPKPKFILPSQDILKTHSIQQAGRIITVQEIKPIALPPPPPPMAQPSAEVAAEFRDRLDAYRDKNPRSGLLFLGATVFRFKDSPPRTLIRYWPEGGKEEPALSYWRTETPTPQKRDIK